MAPNELQKTLRGPMYFHWGRVYICPVTNKQMTQEERTLHKNLESKLNRRGLVSSEWAAIKSLRAKYLIDRGEDPNEWNKNQRTMSHKSIAGDLENKSTNQ